MDSRARTHHGRSRHTARRSHRSRRRLQRPPGLPARMEANVSMSSHSEISVPHTGGFVRLTVDVPDHGALDADEAEFIGKISDMVYGRLRDMLGTAAARPVYRSE